MTQLEDIRMRIDELQSVLATAMSTQNGVQNMRCEDIETLIKYRRMYCELSWQEQVEEEQIMKKRYIDCEAVPIENKIAAVLKWSTESTYTYKADNLLMYKDKVIEYLMTLSDEEKVYSNVLRMISEGGLKFDIEDITRLPPKFFEFVLRKRCYTSCHVIKANAQKQSNADDECDDMCKNIKMSNLERLFINIICSDKEACGEAFFIPYMVEADPRLRVMPTRKTILGGSTSELVDSVNQHYAGAVVSPVIQYRRELGVIIDNNPNQFYKWSDVFSDCGCKGVCTSSITIEFPYMCYAYVDKVEVDVDECYGQREKETYIMVLTGDEYIMRPFRELRGKEPFKIATIKPKVITLKHDHIEKNDLCTHIMISFGLSQYQMVRNIRIYGKAVSFV